MTAPPRPTGWAYYSAVVLFLAVLAFAVLGLVRSTTVARVSGGVSESVVTPAGTPRARTGPVPTAQIPPPTRSAPTQPPSRTYLHPPPETVTTPDSEPAAQPRR